MIWKVWRRFLTQTSPVFASSVLLIAAAATSSTAVAQNYSDSLGPSPKNAYDVVISFGSLLPSRNGLREMIPGWGLRVATPTQRGTFETGLVSAIGNGIVYRSAMIDFRLDSFLDWISTFFILGFHGDQFESTRVSSSFTGGWHYGGGASLYIAGPLLLRFDFRHRFSPGQNLEVTLGLTWRFAAGGA
jgi:hypothetical protein